MTAPLAYFRRLDDDRFGPTHYAQSHWGEDHLNGPSVVGLAAYAVEESFGTPDFMPARLTVDLFKAARGVPTGVELRILRDGRRVHTSECTVVQDGTAVARAVLTQYRRSVAPRGEEWAAPSSFTAPADPGDNSRVYVGSDDAGWTTAIADHQNASRKRTYIRTVEVLEDRPNSAFVRAAIAAEATSLVTNLGSAGVGYINGDLTVALARLPGAGRIAVQADSHWAADGISVGTATLFDSAGAFGTGLVTAISNPQAQIDFTNDPFPDRSPSTQ